MSITNCVDITKVASKNLLEDKEAVDLLADVAEYIQTQKALGNEKSMSDLLTAFKKIAADEIQLNLVQKRNILLNAATERRITEYISNFKNPGEGLKAYIAGSVKKVKGALNSIDARGKSVTNEHFGKLIHDMEKSDVLELFNKDVLEKEIAQELWEIKPDGHPGISGSPEAKKIADIIYKYQQSIIDRQNRLGAWIHDLPGYITRQSHNSQKIRKVGFDSWKETILPLLDVEKTFGPNVEPEEFLKGAYDGLISGLHKRMKAGEDNDFAGYAFGFHGPGSLAKKLSQQRIIHFKDAGSWLKYNDLFGSNNLRESVLYGIEHGAHNIALMEGFGTNPLAMFEKTVTRLKMANRDNIKVFNELSGDSITNLFKEVEGTTRIPGNLSMSRIASGIRAVNNMSKLGAAVVSSLSDIPFQAAELRFQGHNIFSAYSKVLGNLFRGRGNVEQKEIARALGVGFEGILGEIHSRFTIQDSIPGLMSKVQQRFFKLNGMSWWNDAHKTGVGLIMSNHLAEQAGKEFSHLDGATQKVLSLYNIGNREWNVFRNTVYSVESGFKYLTPDKLLNLEDGAILREFPELQPGQVKGFKENLATTWQTYFTDRVDFAVPHPGAAERAIMDLGTRPGTAIGEAVRFFMQFKSFPLSAVRKGLGREIYGSGAETMMEAIFRGKGDLLGLAHVIAATTMFGYMSMAMKDLLKGREPRDPFSVKTALSAMSQGGGMGIYGDFLFGEFSRYGRSFMATVAGPTFGQLDDIAEIYTKLRNGDDAAAQALRTTINNTPFINLFYTRAVMDYLILYQLQEMVNPGFLHRMEARISRENDQQFYLPPSSLISRGGQGGIFESIRK